MSVDTATVKRIASLARIAITDEEADRLAPELGNILGWIEQLGEVDTRDVAAFGSMSADAAGHDGLRSDTPVASLSQTDAIRNAPQGDKKSGTFVVPKVIG